MPYTLWHAGILIGSSELDHASGNPGQRGGVFEPTHYGLAILPRLTGLLSVAHALKAHLEANGKSPETLPHEDVEDLLETTPIGGRMLDLGRMLSEVAVRAPDGQPSDFASIAFTDLDELRRLALAMRLDCAHTLADLPPEASRFIVSVTFRESTPRSTRHSQPEPPQRRHWMAEN